MLSSAIAGSEILMPLGYCFLTRRALTLSPVLVLVVKVQDGFVAIERPARPILANLANRRCSRTHLVERPRPNRARHSRIVFPCTRRTLGRENADLQSGGRSRCIRLRIATCRKTFRYTVPRLLQEGDHRCRYGIATPSTKVVVVDGIALLKTRPGFLKRPKVSTLWKKRSRSCVMLANCVATIRFFLGREKFV